MTRLVWRCAALVCALSALFPSAGHAAARLRLAAAPSIVEPGDTVTFSLRGSAKTCRLTARRGAHTTLRGRLHTTVALTLPVTAKGGDYLAQASCGKRTATAHFGVHDPKGPDFALSVTPLGKASKRAVTRIYRVRAENLAPWPATSARVCVNVAGTGVTITGVKQQASLQTAHAACEIVNTIASGHAGGFDFRVRSAKRRTARIAATATAANSVGAQHGFKARASVAAAHGDPVANVRVKPRPRAHIAQASCTPANRIGVAFVADDSGSMVDNDPDDLRGQAISLGLDQLPDGSLAGATRFADETSQLFDVSAVDATTRAALQAKVRPGLDSYGGTDYELGFQGAQTQLAGMAAADRKAVIFLSDGRPSYDDYTTDQAIADAGVPIFTIGFGDADESILADIAARSGGQEYTAATAGDLQSIFARIVARLNCAAATVSTQLALDPGETQTVPFAVGLGDGEFRALAAWSGGHLTVTAVRPDTSVMAPTALRAGEQFVDNATYALLTGTDPAVGNWQLRIASDAGNADTVHVTIDVFKKNLPPLPVHDPINPKTQGRSVDVCHEMYGNGKITHKHVKGGDQTNYDRTASLFSVCAGFGTPSNIEWPLGMKCAIVSAVAILTAGKDVGEGLDTLDTLCSTVDVLTELQQGNWAGVTGGVLCDFTGKVLTEAGADLAAGFAAETGPGALAVRDVVGRALGAGFKLVCGAIFGGSAATFGAKLEDKHESDIARDILSHGKCLRYTTRLSFVNWNSADCGS